MQAFWNISIVPRLDISPPSFSFINDIFDTNETASGFVQGIIDEIPLPQWAIYVLAILAVIIILLLVLCICICCCKHRRKKRQKKQQEALVKLKQYSGQTNTEHLKVGVKQATSLKAMDLGGSSDPYVKVYILPEKNKTCETRVLKNTLNATFNETFNFQMSKATLVESTAVLQVFDFDRFSKHEIIGELRIKLSQVDWNHVLEEWRDLREPTNEEEENLGEICFSLRYVPVSSTLTVIILEAKNLKSTDLNGSSDPYVKIQLAIDKRKWKKKKSTIKKNTLNPYYNEAFTFKVTLEQIRRVNLVISVWDHDSMTPNDPTGKIFLGCDAPGNQLRHWADMLANPRRPVAQWHTLLSTEQVNAALPLKKKIPFANVEKVHLLRELALK
ncbi:synaptotagmin-1-like isoform X2 [Stigmatopora nigra]